MDRIKNSGFYKLRFFITPEEFRSVLELFEHKDTQFRLTNGDRTRHDMSQVIEAYQAYYRYFTTGEKREGVRPFFVYSIPVTLQQEDSGFFARNEGVQFPYYGQWAEDELPCILLSFPKGLQIEMEDEQGKYYVYEDIRDHRPLTYKLFEDITGYIKKRTKPLRFSALDPEAMNEQKPSVRISRDAKQDMSESWIFAKYGLQIRI
ncbi:hypothetical protein [Paenibacillus solani]|uniref:Uncharacterized protein n=1 Tax=Paenibacillus solani TaxID=1705565 RepID=A0A0M1N1V2_9BACL|nr:hypothetical protein [Paenibacillus solani]KOR76010.1 hypothetical protein AM231_25525 [Paenibacillus solani]